MISLTKLIVRNKQGERSMKKLLIVPVIALAITGAAFAVPEPKYFVCKYVGTPGVDETLQTGQNPISVSGNALTPPIVIGGSFNDAQGRSYVVAEDTGQDEPTCPISENPTPPPVPPTPPVTPPTPPATPPVAPPSLSSQAGSTPVSTEFVGPGK